MLIEVKEEINECIRNNLRSVELSVNGPQQRKEAVQEWLKVNRTILVWWVMKLVDCLIKCIEKEGAYMGKQYV
jgi:hypothetical protein